MEYLVFDVGGTAIKYALMNDELEMLEKGSVPTPLDTLENFLEVIKSIYNIVPVQQQVRGGRGERPYRAG